MDTARLKNGREYSLIVNGLQRGADNGSVRLQFLCGEDAYDDVESAFSDSANTSIIQIAVNGEPSESLAGYTEFLGMSKDKGVVVSTSTPSIEPGSDGELLGIPQPVEEYGDTYTVSLGKPSLRDRVDAIDTEVSELEDTVNTIILSELEGLE